MTATHQHQSDPSYATAVWFWNDVSTSLSDYADIDDADADATAVHQISWVKALHSLECAHRYLCTSTEARKFVDTHMVRLVLLALNQDREKLESCDRDSIEAMLSCCLQIVNGDIKAIDGNNGNNLSVCATLGALDYIFDVTSVFYTVLDGNRDGLPDVWYDLANEFRRAFDFAGLSESQKSLQTFFILFWRGMALKLISSECVQMRQFGWDQISYLLDEVEERISSPLAYEVKGAGTQYINGMYTAVNAMGDSCDLQYHRQIPGKILTLVFRTDDGSKKWVVSETYNDKLGVGEDFNYYYGSTNDKPFPPASGWYPGEKGKGPAPTLEPLYCKDSISLEYQLATWAVDVGLIDLSFEFKDLMHTEVVEPALKLIKFLVDMSLRFSSLPIIGGLSIRDYLRNMMNMTDIPFVQSIRSLSGSLYVTTVFLWNDISKCLSDTDDAGADKNDTTVQVSWGKALDSLKCARHCHQTSSDQRSFIDKYMIELVSLALKQDREELVKCDRDFIEAILSCCLKIVNYDIKANIGNNFVACSTLDVLEKILDAKSEYYDEIDGLGDVWCDLEKDFYGMLDFPSLLKYMKKRTTTDAFPPMSLMKKILAISEGSISDEPGSFQKEEEGDKSQHQAILDRYYARRLTQVVMAHISMLKDSDFTTMNLEDIFSVRPNLQIICYILSESTPEDLFDFFAFWRKMALKLVSSKSLQVQLFGWDEIGRLVDECEKLRPPPRAYRVRGAGTDFVNGTYDFDSRLVTKSGLVKPGVVPQYRRVVPSEGKVLTLSQRTMENEREGWFLSEENNDEPGADEDIDYYQCVLSTNKADPIPSGYGWASVHMGENPAPKLDRLGLVVPGDEEKLSLEHDLAKWAIDNGLVTLALGKSTTGEIVEKSSKMVKLLAEINNEFRWLPAYYDDYDEFSLNQAHLECAIDTLKMMEDAIAVRQIYAMMNSLEILPDDLYDRAWEVKKTAMLRRLCLSDPELLELQIDYDDESDDYDCESGVLYHPCEGAEFAMLGNHVGKNTNLETVRFYGTNSWSGFDTGEVDRFFGGLKQNTSIRNLSLQECDISDGKGMQLLSIFRERRSDLIELELNDCSLGDSGIHLVASTIKACNALKAIKLIENGLSDDQLSELAPCMKGRRDLKTLDLEFNEIGMSSCNTIAYLLQDSLCNIVSLSLDYNNIDDAMAIALSKVFVSNRSVVELGLLENEHITDDELLFDAFAELLFDKSSINAIYLSNHSIQKISDFAHTQTLGTSCLLDCLEMNSLANKREVATRKILSHYSQIDMDPFFEWDLKMFPHAVNWFDRALSYHDVPEEKEAINKMKLTAIYQFVVAMPLFFVPACHEGNLKRKRSSDE